MDIVQKRATFILFYEVPWDFRQNYKAAHRNWARPDTRKFIMLINSFTLKRFKRTEVNNYFLLNISRAGRVECRLTLPACTTLPDRTLSYDTTNFFTSHFSCHWKVAVWQSPSITAGSSRASLRWCDACHAVLDEVWPVEAGTRQPKVKLESLWRY